MAPGQQHPVQGLGALAAGKPFFHYNAQMASHMRGPRSMMPNPAVVRPPASGLHMLAPHLQMHAPAVQAMPTFSRRAR